MNEKILERKLVSAVRKMGGLCIKFVSPGLDGVPDRIILLPGGHIGFAEIKTTGLKPRPLQMRRKRQFEKLGFSVFILDSPEQIGGICEDCGGFFGAKTWNSTSKYKRTIWQCNDKFKDNKPRCTTPHLTEDDIKARFIVAYNSLIPDKANTLDDCRRMMDVLTDTTEIDRKIADLLQEAEVVTGLTRKLIEENAAKSMDQAAFSRKYKGYEDRYNGLKEKVEKLQQESEQRKAQADSISAFMFELHETDEPVTEFDSKLWISVIDSAVVKHSGKLLFRFRNGMEVEG